MLYNINNSRLAVRLCLSACVYARVVAVSIAEFHKAFHSCLSFLSSRNTSLHHSFKTPPLLVSQLFDWHAAAYFPQLCLLSPVVLYTLCTLFLTCVSIFRMAQWCIDCLIPNTSQFPSLSHIYDCECLQNILHHICREWMHAYIYIIHFLSYIIHCHICILGLFNQCYYFV